MPLLVGHLVGHRVTVDARIVDEDVDPAVLVRDGGDERVARAGVAHVELPGGGPFAAGLRRLLGGAPVDVHADHSRPVVGESPGDPCPDAPAGAGHDGNAFLESSHGTCSR